MDAVIAAVAATATAVLTAAAETFAALPKAVVDAAAAELAAAVADAEPVYAREAIARRDFEETGNRGAQIEAIKLFNNTTYVRLVFTSAGPMHLFYASPFSAEGVAIRTGLRVYLVDGDEETPAARRMALWVAPASRRGVRILD